MPQLLFPTRIAHSPSLATEPALWMAREVATEGTLMTTVSLQRALDERIRGGAPGVPTEPRARARECLARALRTPVEPQLARWFHQEALALDPGNADAIRLVGDREPRLAGRLAAVERAVAAGAERAGISGATDAPGGARGEGWHDLTLRPYLRARGRRAELWIEAGRVGEAMAECETLLELDESDALGLRHRLAGLYVVARKHGAFRRLLKRFPEDDSAWACWADVLLALAADDDVAAEGALARARRRCPGVDALLALPWTAPEQPTGYSHGKASEALAVAHDLYPACSSVPGASGWLRGRLPATKPRSPRVRRALEALRPEGDFGPEPAWLEWLVRAQGEVPESLATAARLEGERGVRWTLALLESDALDREGALGSGYGPSSAAALLGDLAPAAAAPAMARLLARSDPESALADRLSVAFRGFGAEALEPLLAARDALPNGQDQGDDGIRDHLLDALVGLGTGDARVFGAVREEFPRNPALGALHFASLGDPAAAPLLSAWVDEQQVDIEDESRLSNMDLYDVLDCLKELTGALSPAHAALEKRILDLRMAVALSETPGGPSRRSEPEPPLLAREPDEPDEPEPAGFPDPGDHLGPEELEDERPSQVPTYAYPQLTALPPVPLRPGPDKDRGRNDPCHCGSTKKYKRCCWDKDHRPPEATKPRLPPPPGT